MCPNEKLNKYFDDLYCLILLKCHGTDIHSLYGRVFLMYVHTYVCILCFSPDRSWYSISCSAATSVVSTSSKWTTSTTIESTLSAETSTLSSNHESTVLTFPTTSESADENTGFSEIRTSSITFHSTLALGTASSSRQEGVCCPGVNKTTTIIVVIKS